MLVGVRVGESGIGAIMHRYDVTCTHDIKTPNNMPLEDVREGMIVQVLIENDMVHVVKPFESIESIADKYSVTPQYIREYNNIDSVFLGDKVYIEKRKK